MPSWIGLVVVLLAVAARNAAAVYAVSHRGDNLYVVCTVCVCMLVRARLCVSVRVCAASLSLSLSPTLFECL
jgi:hypothetical protein